MRSWTLRHSPVAFAVLGLAVAVFVMAWLGIALTRENDRIAAVWLANGFIVAALLRHPQRCWPALVIGAFGANVAANISSGDAWHFGVSLALINQLESVIVAWAVWPLFSRAKRIDDLTVVVRFLIATVAGCALSAVLAGSFVSLTTGASPWAVGANWWVSDSLGLLIVTPLILSLQVERQRLAWKALIEPVGLVVGSAMLAGWVFWQTDQPLLFTLALLVFYSALRLSLFGAMAVVCAVSAAGLVATLSGHGVIAQTNLDPTQRMYVFQLFVAVQLFSVLPIRALVHQRDMLGLAAAESDRLFRRIAEASPSGILHLDAAGRPTFANGRWTDITGVSIDRLHSENWLDIVDSSFASAARSLWARARAIDQPVSGEFPLVGDNEARRWGELNIYPEVEGQRLLGFVARLSDITARREAERALVESETLYRVVTENSHDAVLRLDADGRVLYASSALERSFGIALLSAIGQSFTKVVHSDDVEVAASMLSATAYDGPPVVQFRVTPHGRDPIWVEAGYRPLLDAQSGKLIETVVSLRDIDRRRQQERKIIDFSAKLRERNRVLSMAEDLAEVGHWRFDFASGEMECSHLTQVVGGFAKASGVSPSEAIAAVYPDDRVKILRAVTATRRSSSRQVIGIRVGEEGRFRHVRLAIQADTDSHGRITGLFGVVRDKSEYVLAQQQLIEARDQAQAAARAKSQFLATMSHEIRTPMTGVLGMIELLRDEQSGEERDRYFSTLKQSADLLMAVLDDVLDFSKVESGALRLDRTTFDLTALLASTVELFGNAASRKGLLLSFDTNIGGAAVVADAVRLQQVVSNLLSNAIKFTSNGEVVVSLSCAGRVEGAREWLIEVRDSGIGIAPESMAALFQPFVQAETNIAHRFGGTGLGLAISKRLVEAMGGDLTVQSRLGEGSLFRVRLALPDAASPVPSTPATSAGQTAAPSGGLDVLVAEDNPVNQLLISAILKRLGHRVRMVGNGLEAVEACRTSKFDVVLMDMQMPEMDGLAATRAIRSAGGDYATLPIVALTADASPERRRFYDGAGLTHFMTKPIDQAQLASWLSTIADGTSSTRQPVERLDRAN